MKNHAPRWRTEGGVEIESGKPQSSNRFSSPSANSHRRSTLDEPVIVAEWLRNRGGETIWVRLSTYEGHYIADVRTCWAEDDGQLKPKKGFACAVKHPPTLVEVFLKANTRVKELGLIEGEETRQ
jgi:hypothetical protein